MTRLDAGVKECVLSFASRMSSQSSEPRHTPPPYASLRAVAEAAAATTASSGPPNGAAKPPSDPSYWRQEADKLDVLLQTLWGGFLDAGTNGLPTALADYVSAYTGAMRLKLTLLGYSTSPNRTFKAAAPVDGKVRTP